MIDDPYDNFPQTLTNNNNSSTAKTKGLQQLAKYCELC